jgi:hypothetical protein
MPSQRAQILGELGTAANDPMSMMTQMQQRLLQNNKLSRENAQSTNFANLFKTSPVIQDQISKLPPEYQAIANAYGQSGDLPGYTKFMEDFKPKWDAASGTLYDPLARSVFDKDTGTTVTLPKDLTEANSPTATGALNSKLTGDDYLKTLPQQTQNSLSLVLNGGIPASSVLNRLPPAKKSQFLSMLAQADPDFNTADVDARNNIRKGFTKDGQTSLRTMGTAIGSTFAHGNELLDSFKENGNGNVPWINSLRNEYSNVTGGSGPVGIKSAVQIFATETLKALKGGTPTQGEVDAMIGNLPDNASPEQARKVVDKISKMAVERGQQLDSVNERTMGSKYWDNGKYSVFTPEAAQAIKQYQGNPYGVPASSGNRAALEAEARRRGLIQ